MRSLCFQKLIKAVLDNIRLSDLMLGCRMVKAAGNLSCVLWRPHPDPAAQDMLQQYRERERVSSPSHPLSQPQDHPTAPQPTPWSHRPLPHSVIVLSRLEPPNTTTSCTSPGPDNIQQSSYTIVMEVNLLLIKNFQLLFLFPFI